MADEAKKARLTIDGSAYNVPLGEPFAVRIGGNRVTMQIDPQSEQSFSEAGIAFSYPDDFDATDSDAGEGIQVWTFQGPSAAVMLQRYDDGIDVDSLREVLVDNLVERDGVEPQQRQNVKLTGPERAYQGVQVRTSRPAKQGSPATDSVQNIFTFANESGVFALMIQDVHPPGAEDSAEYTEALRLLGETLQTGPAPRPSNRKAPAGANR